MTEVQGGRHCRACSKTVIDFTVMTDKQIVALLSSSQNVCGRVGQLQLDGINRGLNFKRQGIFSRKGFSIAASLLFAFPVTNVFAQHKVVKTKQTRNHKAHHAINDRTISGIVRDSTDMYLLPGVLIAVKGTNINCATGINGNYTINVPETADTLIVSFAGYNTHYIALPHDSNMIDITLTESGKTKVVGYTTQQRQVMLGGAIAVMTVKKIPFYKRWYYRLIKNPVKKIFG